MSRVEKLQRVINILFGGVKKYAAAGLGITAITLNSALTNNGGLPFIAIEEMSRLGIDVQWYTNDEYAISMFNTSYAGAALALQYPEYSGRVDQSFIDSDVAIRLRTWIEKYVGKIDEFIEKLDLSEPDEIDMWRLKVRGALALAPRDLLRLEQLGINTDYLFAKAGVEVDEFSSSTFYGKLMRVQRDMGEKVIFPDNIRDSQKLLDLAKRVNPELSKPNKPIYPVKEKIIS